MPTRSSSKRGRVEDTPIPEEADDLESQQDSEESARKPKRIRKSKPKASDFDEESYVAHYARHDYSAWTAAADAYPSTAVARVWQGKAWVRALKHYNMLDLEYGDKQAALDTDIRVKKMVSTSHS